MRLIILAVMMVPSCFQRSTCTPEDMRCEDTSVVICNGDSYWEPVVDCRSWESVCVDGRCVK